MMMASALTVLRLALIVPSVFGFFTPAPLRNEETLAPGQKATVLPSDDPFYWAPKGFEAAERGTVFRSRPVPNAITLNNVTPIKPKAAWQLLYRTQNSVGEPSVNVVTLLVPHNVKPNHLFVYSMFSDAAYNGCNPSISMQVGTREDNTFNQLQNAILVEGMNLGYYVSVADDGGFQAAFASGLQAGYATLDSIRAVKQSGNITGINADPIITMHGYSNGAQTIGWATELHPTYSPELKIAGAALGGLIPNLSALLELERYSKGERARFGPPVMLGLSHDFANLSMWMNQSLVPENEAEYRKAEHHCFDSNSLYSYQDLGKYYKKGYNSLSEPIPRSVVATAGTMGYRSTPTIPWYLYEALADDASPIDLTDRLYKKHCANGANILYERNLLKLDHRTEFIFGAGGAFSWMKDRHEGLPITPGCQTLALSLNSLKGSGETLLLRGVIGSILAWMGANIGPNPNQTNPLGWT